MRLFHRDASCIAGSVLASDVETSSRLPSHCASSESQEPGNARADQRLQLALPADALVRNLGSIGYIVEPFGTAYGPDVEINVNPRIPAVEGSLLEGTHRSSTVSEMRTHTSLMVRTGTFQIHKAGDRQRLPEQRLLQILLEQDGAEITCVVKMAGKRCRP